MASWPRRVCRWQWNGISRWNWDPSWPRTSPPTYLGNGLIRRQIECAMESDPWTPILGWVLFPFFWQPSPKFLGSSPPFGSRIGFHASYFSASKSALTAETLKRSLSFCCTRVRLFAMPMQPEHHKRVSVRIKSEASMILQQWARGFSKLNALAKLKHQSIMLHVLRNKIEQVKPPRIFKRIPSPDHIGCPPNETHRWNVLDRSRALLQTHHSRKASIFCTGLRIWNCLKIGYTPKRVEEKWW